MAVSTVLVLLYAQLSSRLGFGYGRTSRGVLGAVLGSAAVLGMLAPAEAVSGFTLDGRAVLMAVAGPLGGLTAAVVAAAVAIAGHIAVKAAVVPPALLAIAAAAFLGWGAARFAEWTTGQFRTWHFCALGGAVATVTSAINGAAGPEMPAPMLAAKMLLIFGGTMLLGSILIHERRRRETECDLAESESRFRSLLENMRDIVFWHGEKGSGAHGYTQVGTAVFGVDAHRLAGTAVNGRGDLQRWYDSIHPEDRPAYLAAEAARKERGERYVLDYRFIHPETGELRWMRETGWTVADNSRDRTYFDSYMVDVTEERRSAERVRDALRRADAANRAKAEFLANMSHELRTPLNAVIGFSELIEREMFGPVGQPVYVEYAGDIRSSGEHLLEVITDILEFAKAEAGEVMLDNEIVDIEDAIDFCQRMVAPRAERAGVVVTKDIAAGLPAISADERRLRQILLNLLSNAIKYTPSGGTVTVAARRHGAALQLTVSDTGIGIAPENLRNVLEPFRQVSNSMNRTHAGTGLGLPLVKRLVELHGGVLEINSAVGAGTRVVVSLPTERFDAPAVADLARVSAA